MADITFIVPYCGRDSINTELIQAIREQATRFSFIFVDDNSPDDSNTYLRSELGTLVDIRPNTGRGPADARNSGLFFSATCWVAFIDSDDIVSNDYWDSIVRLIEGCGRDYELIRFGFIKDGVAIDCREESLESVCAGYGYSVIWNKVYRRDFLVEHKVRFRVGGGPFEDISFLVKLYSRNPRVLHRSDLFIYEWKTRVGSLTNSVSRDYFLAIHSEYRVSKRLLSFSDAFLLQSLLRIRFLRMTYYKASALQSSFEPALCSRTVSRVKRVFNSIDSSLSGMQRELLDGLSFNEIKSKLSRCYSSNSLDQVRIFESERSARDFSFLLNKMKEEVRLICEPYDKILIYGYGVLGQIVDQWLSGKIIGRFDRSPLIESVGDLSDLLSLEGFKYDAIVIAILGQDEVTENLYQVIRSKTTKPIIRVV